VVAAARPGLALACADVEAQLLLFSSDLVFDGSQRDPYTETDPARPFERSGAYCVAAEAILACTWPDSLVIRTGPLFGCTTRSLTASHANRGRTTRFAANDDVISPSLLSDVVRNALDLLVDQEIGVWHLASPGGVSWGEFFAMLGIDTSQRDRNESTGGVPDSKPRHHVLGSERGQIMPLISAS
jgi:dTDP-4-dehydrorhamnose reductase